MLSIGQDYHATYFTQAHRQMKFLDLFLKGYFVYVFQTMPVAMALLRDVQNLCPKDVLNFILDLIKYNDNRKNKVKTVEYLKFSQLS